MLSTNNNEVLTIANLWMNRSVQKCFVDSIDPFRTMVQLMGRQDNERPFALYGVRTLASGD